jgi:hypothetical protein
MIHCTDVRFSLLGLKRKTLKYFMTITYHITFKFGTPGGMTKIQMILDICPRVLKHVVGYNSHSETCGDFELLQIALFDLIEGVRNHL